MTLDFEIFFLFSQTCICRGCQAVDLTLKKQDFQILDRFNWPKDVFIKKWKYRKDDELSSNSLHPSHLEKTQILNPNDSYLYLWSKTDHNNPRRHQRLIGSSTLCAVYRKLLLYQPKIFSLRSRWRVKFLKNFKF